MSNSSPFRPNIESSKSGGSVPIIPTTMSMSHFLFPPNLFAHGFCHLGAAAAAAEHQNGEDQTKSEFRDKMSKSFTIDSLLGLSNAAARAVLQSGISHHHHHHHQTAINLANSIRSNSGDCWRFDNDYEYGDISSDGKGSSGESASGLWFNPYGNQTQSHHLTANSTVIPTTIPSNNYLRKSEKNANSHLGKGKKNSESGLVVAAGGGTDKSTLETSTPQLIRRAAKTKRVRTIFTPEQLERLEAEFERQQYMVGPERLYLASSLNLTEAQVKVWFQNRRIKWRKQHFEMQQQRLAVLRSRQTDLDDEDSSGSDFGSEESERSSNVVSSIFDGDVVVGSLNSSQRDLRHLKELHRK